MVDPGQVILDLEILSEQSRCQKAVNVAVGVADESGAGEIAPLKL